MVSITHKNSNKEKEEKKKQQKDKELNNVYVLMKRFFTDVDPEHHPLCFSRTIQLWDLLTMLLLIQTSSISPFRISWKY